jgi:hypothetical protein
LLKNSRFGAVEKRSSAVLRCKPHRSTYVYIRLAMRFLRALHLSIFEQPPAACKHYLSTIKERPNVPITGGCKPSGGLGYSEFLFF